MATKQKVNGEDAPFIHAVVLCISSIIDFRNRTQQYYNLNIYTAPLNTLLYKSTKYIIIYSHSLVIIREHVRVCEPLPRFAKRVALP